MTTVRRDALVPLPPIAVVGVSALFPGSTDARGFWRDILAGRDLLTDVPPSHWLVADHYDPDPAAPDKTYARRGAFLPEVDFHPLELGVPPNAVPATDTSQLLGLIVAQQVLEDATQGDLARLEGLRVGVILGATSAQELMLHMSARLQRPVWLKALRESGVPEDEAQRICDRIAAHYQPWQESTFPGLLGNVIAGRIANRFNLDGTNCVTDAACASSLSALAMGAYELALGRADMIIAGGVDTLNDASMFLCFSKTPALSARGDCRPFDASSDGTMLGEGLGMLALRRLDDAERAGDRIYAVIRGIGTSSDGRALSVYAPLVEGQAKALRMAYEDAGYGPETVELMEAHGTGTRAGDLAELTALARVFDESGRADRQWCALGSIKSQIGHTKAAAGVAGLFKVVLALHHKVLPPTLKVERPNPKLELEKGAFYLNTESRPWIRDDRHPRRASLSSFGFGGSNFHVALEEYVGPSTRAPRLRTLPSELIVLSAHDVDALNARGRELLQADAAEPLAVLARRSQEAFDVTQRRRLSVVAVDRDDLGTKLEAALEAIRREPDGPGSSPHHAYGIGPCDGSVAFLFPGQGSQYVGMGADLAMAFDAAREVWDREASTSHAGDTRLHAVVFPSPAFSDAEREEQAARLTATEWAQPAIGAASLAPLALLRRLGVEPQALGGHSFGEVTALHAAAVLSERDFFAVARERGRAMAEAARTGRGAMTAVATSLSDLRPRLATWGIDVAIANDNGPRQVVLSSHVAEIARVEERLEEAGLGFRRLPVATAFHSPLVASCAETFGRFLGRVSFEAPSIAVHSNVETGPHSSDPDSIRQLLAAQIGSPVRFAEMLDAMYDRGVRTFIEVGPGSVLTGLVGQCLAGRPHLAVSLDRKGLPGVTAFWLGLGRLAAAGLRMDWEPLWEHIAPYSAPRREKGAFSIKISGTNAGKPYPPPGGAAALPPPNPPRDIPSETPARPVAPPMAMAGAPPVPASMPKMAGPDGLGKDIAQAHEIYQRALAEAHQKYLATMESTLRQGHTAFLKSMETSFLAVCGAVQGSPVEWPAMPPVAADPVVFTPPVAERPPASTPAPVGAPAAARTAAAVRPDMAAIVLAVIAEKTGYPGEMLQPEMALESDLGIDSIKRVEILSALQDRVADLPRVEAAEMASLRTIGAVITRLSARPTDAGCAGTDADLSEILRQVVAEKTGYPAEMLGLEMSLEADLGIDSIKRVEILSALQERVPGLPRLEPAVIASLRTIGAVATHLAREMGQGPAPPSVARAAVESAPATAPHAIARGVVEVVPASVSGRSLLPLLRGGRVAVVPDEGGIEEALVRLLRERDVDAALAPETPSGARHLLFLAGLGHFADDEAAIAVNRTAFRCVREAAGTLEDGGLLLLAQDTGGDFGLAGRDARRAWSAGLGALAKTAAREWPSATMRVVDLERGERPAAELAAALVAELEAGSDDVEVGLRADGRRVTTIVGSASGGGSAEGSVLDERSVVVATGGARGVTAASLLELARRTRSRFVLLGRTTLVDEPAAARGVEGDAPLKHALRAAAQAEGRTPSVTDLASTVQQIAAAREIRATLDAFERVGAAAVYCPADTRDARALADVLAGVRERWGPITAVVHGAGVRADKRIVEKTPEDFDRVFDTKVLGLRALLEATADDPLRLIALFSSVAARHGNAGQCDYAMANEVLNKVAAALARERPSCVVKSIGWGPWDGGMVDPSLKAHFVARGVALIPIDAGATLFADEVLRPRDGVEIVIGTPLAAEAPPASFRVPIEVDAANYAWLGDHRIDEVVAVPAMLVLEWFSRAARVQRPDLVVTSCHDLRVLRGILLRGFPQASARFTIQGRETARPQGAALALDLLSPDGARHYSAIVEMQLEGAPGAANGNGNGRGHDALCHSVPLAASPWQAPELYRDVLFHGPALQVLRSVDGVSAEGIAGTLVGLDGLGWTGSWEIDVAALDGGLQLALAWSAHVSGRPSLPTRIGSFRTLRHGFFKSPVRCLLRGQRLDEHRTLSHIVFEDTEGRWLAELTDVELHLRAPVEPA